MWVRERIVPRERFDALVLDTPSIQAQLT